MYVTRYYMLYYYCITIMLLNRLLSISHSTIMLLNMLLDVDTCYLFWSGIYEFNHPGWRKYHFCV